MSNKERCGRQGPEGRVPFLSFEGTAAACGEQLGYAWREALRLEALERSGRPWWQAPRLAGVIEELAPHLPDLYRGMAKGAGLKPEQVGDRMPPEEGCTSFAVAPSATLEGGVIAGQTKDTGIERLYQFQVLRLAMSDAPGVLTLTYPGWLYGHGFVAGRCAVFRNALFTQGSASGLPYFVWGVLALHCREAGEAVELVHRLGVRKAWHCTVVDAQGGIVGIEQTDRGTGVLSPGEGLYVHANAVVSDEALAASEQPRQFSRENSLFRVSRLRELLEPELGRVTAPGVWRLLGDHAGYPQSLCRHEGTTATTTAAVVVEPGRGLMHVSRGAPCENWPVTYRL